MLNNIAIIQILIGILLDAIIFYILYSKINSGNSYIKNVLIYTIGMEIKLIIATGTIVKPVMVILLGRFFLIALAIHFVIGLALIFILDRLCSSSYIDKMTFIIISMLMQIGIISLLSLFII